MGPMWFLVKFCFEMLWGLEKGMYWGFSFGVWLFCCVPGEAWDVVLAASGLLWGLCRLVHMYG